MGALDILLVTRNLPPLWGGMERLNWHLADELSRSSRICVVGPRGSATLAPPGVRLSEVPLQPLFLFLFSALWRSLIITFRMRPKLILAGSGLTAPIVLLAARVSGARCAAYVHGLDIAVRNPLYRWVWLPALRKMDTVVANSRATADLAVHAGIAPERIAIVHPGVAVETGIPEGGKQEFRRRFGLQSETILLSVGRLTKRKGLREFVRDVLPRVVARRPDAVLVIIGDVPRQALLKGVQTPESILEAARAAGVGRNVRFLGVVTDARLLSCAYASALVHVFPVQEIEGDPEGFGMVAVEAAAHALPTVAYATGGVVDAVADGVSGRLVAPGDAAAFSEAILDVLRTPEVLRPGAQHFAGQFSWDQFGCKLRRAIGLP